MKIFLIKKFKFLLEFTSIISICWLLSCGSNSKVYRFATAPKGTSYYDVGKNIARVVNQKNEMNIQVFSEPVYIDGDSLTFGAITSCKLLQKGQVDFAISQNDIPIESLIADGMNPNFFSIRSILPLYPEIFFLLYKGQIQPNSLQDLIVGRNVAMGPRDSGTARLAKIIFQEFGIDTSEYTPQYINYERNLLSDSVDVCCMVTGYNNPRIEKSLKIGGKLFSLGSYQLVDKGSEVEGFCLKYPLAKTYIIPKNTFGGIPEEPVLTVAVDAVLLTHEEIPSEVVYNLIKTIFENKQLIAIDLDNKLLSQITERFDPLKMHFQLHPGARQYLERDRPSFLEKYAEMLAFIFSILLATLGSASTIAKWTKQRKKERVDRYYNEIIQIQRQIKEYHNHEWFQLNLEKINSLRESAFQQLIAEKLIADESFKIFLDFLNDVKSEIQQRIHELREKEC